MYVMYACMLVQSFDAIVINGVAVVMPSCWGVVLGGGEGGSGSTTYNLSYTPGRRCHIPMH